MNRSAWLICCLLLAATVLNYLDRQVLSLTAERVISEFHMSREGFGEVLSSFRYSYAAVQVLGGWLADFAGSRLLFPIAVALWSGAGIATSYAQTIDSFRASRFLLGIGEALNWPCALKTTEQLLEQRDRALANGFFNGGTAIGAIIAPLIVTILVRQSGWRLPFLVTGSLGLLWVMVWPWATRKHKVQMRGGSVAPARVPGIMLQLACRKEFWLLMASAIIVNGVSYFLADWIPLYLKADRAFGFIAANALSMVVYAFFDAGNLLSGYFVRRATIGGTKVERARMMVLNTSCLCMSFAALAGFVPWRYFALACIGLTAAGTAGFLVTYLTMLQDISPSHVGTMAGMLGGIGNLAYGVIAPWIGRFSDLHRTSTVFLLIGIMPWLAYFCIAPVVKAKSDAIQP